MHHFGWQVLSRRTVERDRAVFRARHEDVAVGRVAKLFDWLVKLGELVELALLLHAEDPHRAGLEAAGEDRRRGVRGDAEGLVDLGDKEDRVLEVVHGPKFDGAVLAAGDDHVLGHMEVH